MNTQDALELHARFLELKKLVEQKVPQTIILPHPWHDDSTLQYNLTHVVLEDLSAHYRSYVGCGEYVYTDDHIDLSTLFGA